MKPKPDRLKGVTEIGLPDPDKGPSKRSAQLACKKKTAAPARPRCSGRKGLHEDKEKPLRKECGKSLHLTSLGLIACFTDEGHLFGWEVTK